MIALNCLIEWPAACWNSSSYTWLSYNGSYICWLILSSSCAMIPLVFISIYATYSLIIPSTTSSYPFNALVHFISVAAILTTFWVELDESTTNYCCCSCTICCYCIQFATICILGSAAAVLRFSNLIIGGALLESGWGASNVGVMNWVL